MNRRLAFIGALAFQERLSNFLPAPKISLLILLKAFLVTSNINLFKNAYTKRKCLKMGNLVGKFKIEECIWATQGP